MDNNKDNINIHPPHKKGFWKEISDQQVLPMCATDDRLDDPYVGMIYYDIIDNAIMIYNGDGWEIFIDDEV